MLGLKLIHISKRGPYPDLAIYLGVSNQELGWDECPETGVL